MRASADTTVKAALFEDSAAMAGLGPDHLIVAAKVAFSDEISADRAEDVADEIDRRLVDRLLVVPHVFLDPTQARAGARSMGGLRHGTDDYGQRRA